MAEEDVRLMLAFKAGDYDAFSALVDRYQKSLVRFFYGQSHDQQLAEDCTQETWRRIFSSRSEYVPRARFRTFLFRVARNLWIDQVRSRQKRGTPLSLDREWGSDEDSGAATLGRVIPAENADPELDAMRRELRERIESALEKLADGQKEVFVLSEFEGMKYWEIAEVLEIPVGTVKSRMFNAMRRLRELLRQDD